MKQDREITIVGISLRTSNNEAMETIPPLWGRFYGEGILEQVSNRISDEVYAVYTDFENEGLNNEGNYTLIIGVEVKDLDNIPKGLVTTTIKVQNREVFSVSEGKPENVGATWMDIWQRDDLKKTFISEYEHYHIEGIDIYIGIE
jgi:predicted transcriptional regulator YdeE